MSETLSLQKSEKSVNPVLGLDDMVSWFAVHRDKYPGYDEVAKKAREDLLKIVESADRANGQAQEVTLELRPLSPNRDIDSVYYSENPMSEGTNALLSQIYRATGAEQNMLEGQSTYDENTGDSRTVYRADVAGHEIFLTEERIDNVTSLKASVEVPGQRLEARLGSLVIVGQDK